METGLNSLHVLMLEPQCRSEMNATEQTFVTLNYPHNYFSNYECQWNIRAARGTIVILFVYVLFACGR